MKFTIQETTYNIGYYLVDGIYPNCATLVKTIPMSQGEKRKLFAKCQEVTRNDVERAFGVLKSHFAIICGPSRNWQTGTMKNIILACIILNNMIVEDEWDMYNGNFDVDYDHIDKDISNIDVSQRQHIRRVHQQLQAYLVKHIWERFDDNNDEI